MVKKKESNDSGLDGSLKEDAQTECMVKLTGLDLVQFELYQAIENNDIELAKKSILLGADVNSLSKPCAETKETPLEVAVYWANTYNYSMDMIRLLKAAGAYLFDKDKVQFIGDEYKIKNLDKIINKKKI